MEGMLIFLIVGLIVAGIATYFFISNYKKYSLIQKTETSAISMVYDGFNEIKGRVVPQGMQLSSPFSEKDCVYYHFIVEQKKSSGKSSHWVKIIDDEKYVKFGIDDNSGTAIIDMQGADVHIKTDVKDSSGFFNAADEREKAVLQKYNQTSKTWIFEKSLRYTEKFLETGDELYVLGEAIGKDGRNPLFSKGKMKLFVSDKSENELLKYYRLRFVISAVAIIAVVLLNVWLYMSI